MRRPFAAGNWKMNLSLKGAQDLATGLRKELAGVKDVDIAVCPPFVFVPAAVEALQGSNIDVGAQNMYFKDAGAFTGEVAGPMLKDVGCKYVILGHSERRHIFAETDKAVNLKVKAALGFGLEIICCVGELLQERETNKTQDVVSRQVEAGLEDVTPEQMEHITIAYEPVWAIGTGLTATPAQAQEVHAMIRAILAKQFGAAVADAVRIQYGGSVNEKNAKELMSAPDIDGVLVGGASLKIDTFATIVRAAIR
jgi:triosephosphate isomerase (TIM)